MKQAYASEPVLFSSSPITPANSSKPVSPQRRRSRGILVLVAIITMLVGSGAWIAAHDQQQKDFPVAVRQSVNFLLYVPSDLPNGYYLDYQSASAISQAITFSINSRSGKALVVTEQPQPPDDQVQSFYDQQLTTVRTVPTGKGTIVFGEFETSRFAGVTTGNTWVLIRAVSAIEQDELERITHSFKALN
jgi:hypothetical protein